MRHATANRPSGARRPLAAAIAVAVITAAPVAAVGVNDAISALQQNGQYAADASHDDVMSAGIEALDLDIDTVLAGVLQDRKSVV